MTIGSATVATSGSAGNGATTQFSFSFSVESYGAVTQAEQIEVLQETIATGDRTVLTLTTHYTTSFNADQSSSPGGSVTLLTAPSSSYKIWIRLAPSFLQALDLVDQGAFNASVIEAQLDQMQRQINTLRDRVRRSPVVDTPVGASFAGEITGPFTPGYAIVVNSLGTGFNLAGSLDGATASAAWAAVIESATLALGLSAAGLGTEDAVTFAGVTSVTTINSTNAGVFKNTADNANNRALRVESDRATPAANDSVLLSFYLSDSAGNQDEMGRIVCTATSVTSGAEASRLDFLVATGGAGVTTMRLSPTALTPNTNDLIALGTTSLMWSDLFLASGAVINFNNGDVTYTHSAGLIKIAGLTSGLELEVTQALSGGVTDSYTGSLVLDPGYSGAQTVTRHNYIDAQNPSVSGSTVTNACLVRFDAAAGTHKAVDAATTKTTPGGVDAWVKININGTLYYMPAYTSKTA